MLKVHEKFLQGILKTVKMQPIEMVSINEALGRVLAQDIRAKCTSPSSDISTIDGYAVISSDITNVPIALERVGESNSKQKYTSPVFSGQTVEIAAGSAIPDGSDSVISLDMVERKDSTIIFKEMPLQGQNICYTGFDFSENDVVLGEGSILNARDIGLAISMGIYWLPVRRRPRIAVFTIGDELVMPGHQWSENQKPSCSIAIDAFIKASGAEPVDLGIARDTGSSIKNLIDASEDTEMIISMGSTSKCSKGTIKETLKSLKMDVSEVEICLNSNTQVIYANNEHTHMLALPGNPISAQICYTLFVQPVLNTYLNLQESFHKSSLAILNRDLDVNDIKMHYIFSRLTVDENKQLAVLPASSQDKVLLSEFSHADCVITVDLDHTHKGDTVTITRFPYYLISG